MMKKSIYIILFFALIAAACKKGLETEPLDLLTEDRVFDPADSSGVYAQQYLNDIYSNLPTGFNRIGGNLLDAATDDALPSQDGTSIENLGKGQINSGTNPDDAWAKNYTGIQKVNLFLSKIDIVPRDAATKTLWKADARFLRAMSYFELIKRYGGVPLVGDSVFKVTDNIQLKRNTFEECVNYIVKECDAIKTIERTDPVASADWGRISRGIVYTLKAKVLLYAASPLFNGGSGSANGLQGYPTYDKERWNVAAQAVKDVINLNVYGLETSYTTIFITRRSALAKPEVILAYLRAVTTDVEGNNGPVGFTNAADGDGKTSPTQDLVDAFPMLNGKDITDAASGYSATAPYTGRDKRLDNTVLYNGTMWLSKPLETFVGGISNPTTNMVKTKTGYYMRKFMADFSTATQYANKDHNFVIFRYADVMLMNAEALNEYNSSPTPEVYQVLKDIRKRAGITVGADGLYGLKANMTQAEMRDAIRNERRIEMAFEEQRFWDLRRWKIAETVLNKSLSGMKITKTGTTLTYQKVVAGQVVFPSRMYLYPIPYSEISKNRSLIQNSGW
jgi:hypothetical protein